VLRVCCTSWEYSKATLKHAKLTHTRYLAKAWNRLGGLAWNFPTKQSKFHFFSHIVRDLIFIDLIITIIYFIKAEIIYQYIDDKVHMFVFKCSKWSCLFIYLFIIPDLYLALFPLLQYVQKCFTIKMREILNIINTY